MSCDGEDWSFGRRKSLILIDRRMPSTVTIDSEITPSLTTPNVPDYVISILSRLVSAWSEGSRTSTLPTNAGLRMGQTRHGPWRSITNGLCMGLKPLTQAMKIIYTDGMIHANGWPRRRYQVPSQGIRACVFQMSDTRDASMSRYLDQRVVELHRWSACLT